MNDYTYCGLTSSSPQIQSSFWNPSRDKRYSFNFSEIPSFKSLESPPNSRVGTNSLYGARGTVSIYFYKGLKVLERLTSIPYYTLNRSKIIETRFRSEINLLTKFDEIIDADISSKPIVDMVKQSNDPIAVLHIHYRSEPWLISIGMPIRNYGNSSTECTQNCSKGVRATIANSLSANAADASPFNDQVRDVTDVTDVTEQLNILVLIQPFEKPSDNEDLGNKTNARQTQSVVETLNGGDKRVSTNVSGEGFWKENTAKKGRAKRRKKRKKKGKGRKGMAKKRKVEESQEKNIVKTVKKEKQVVTSNTSNTKYKEYVEREYHTSDYIEFGDDDQILREKTYYVEKTIIDLEDTE